MVVFLNFDSSLETLASANNLPAGTSCIVNGDYTVGEMMTADRRVPLVSATGSIRMGKIVAQAVAARLGRSLLELGGNNAIIITPAESNACRCTRIRGRFHQAALRPASGL